MKTELELDVRLNECDLGGVVHHSVYAIWYETARMDFFARLGLNYEKLREWHIAPTVADLHVTFRAPVRYPGRVRITTSVASYGPRKIELRYALHCGGVLCNEATTLVVWTDQTVWKAMDLERAHPELYEAIARAAAPEA